MNELDEFERTFQYFDTSIDHEELNIIDSNVNLSSNWFFTCEIYENRSTLIVYQSKPFSSTIFRNPKFNYYFANLKRLNMGFMISESKGFNFEVLNDFNGLEQLEIHYLSIRTKQQLCLPNLKYLFIGKLKRTEKPLLIIDAPKLVVFFCSQNLELIHFEHPNSIELLYLERNSINQISAVFSNLKILCCEQIFIKRDEQLKSNLNLWPNLKELHFFEFISKY